ncbi:MAG: glycosyltransferase family 4 protein [Bacteroidia bacterium]|nr:glycosyltransferase family 4 protein [Bacteroidia bacterium]
MKAVFVFGGIPHYVIKILNRLHEDIDVHVVVPDAASKTIGDGVHQTDKGIRFGVTRLKEITTYYRKPGFKDFRKTVLALHPDVLVMNWPYYLMLLFYPRLRWQLKSRKVKLVVREIPFTLPAWNESFKEFGKTAVEAQKNDRLFTSRMAFYGHKLVWKILYSRIFHAAMCYTSDGKRILGSYGMPVNRVHTVHNSIDNEDLQMAIDALQSEKLERKKNRIIHVGRLVFWKRVDLLIQALAKLKNSIPDIELLVVGKGEEEQNLKQLVRDLKIEDAVQFVGAVYDEKDLCRYFQTSDLYVLAGMGGLSINEAMANGLPVVCSVCDGTEKHLVFDGRNGKYFKHDDLDSLTSAIELVLSDPEALKQMGTESLNIVKNEINIKIVVENMRKALLAAYANQPINP